MTQIKQPKPGDIYVRQWGLDSTSLSFYQIKKIIHGKTIELQLIKSLANEDKILPVANEFIDKPFRRRLTNNGLIKIIKQDFGDRFYAKPFNN